MKWKSKAILSLMVMVSIVGAINLEKGKICTPNTERTIYRGQELCIEVCDVDGSNYTTKDCCRNDEVLASDEKGGFRCELMSNLEVKPTKQPAFEIMFAIGGLLIVGYLIRKRKVIR